MNFNSNRNQMYGIHVLKKIFFVEPVFGATFKNLIKLALDTWMRRVHHRLVWNATINLLLYTLHVFAASIHNHVRINSIFRLAFWHLSRTLQYSGKYYCNVKCVMNVRTDNRSHNQCNNLIAQTQIGTLDISNLLGVWRCDIYFNHVIKRNIQFVFAGKLMVIVFVSR